MSKGKTQMKTAEIKKTGHILVKPWLTKPVHEGQTIELTTEEYQCASDQGFLEEGGQDKAAKTSKRPGKKNTPVDETK